MIVVDSNVIAYCWIDGARTALAQRVRVRDPEWHVPVLWRSELRSIVTGYLRQGTMDPAQAAAIMAATEAALGGREHLMASAAVLELAAATRLSAYDCEFVALAESLSAALVTEDREVLKAFPDLAFTMEGFLAAREKAPQARAPRGQYRVRTASRAPR